MGMRSLAGAASGPAIGALALPVPGLAARCAPRPDAAGASATISISADMPSWPRPS